MSEDVVEEASAVSRAVGRSFSGMSLQALENRSTATRMVVKPLEAGKSVAKSTPRWDQGRHGIGRGTSLPSGRRRCVEIMSQTEYPFTNRGDVLGHVGPPIPSFEE